MSVETDWGWTIVTNVLKPDDDCRSPVRRRSTRGSTSRAMRAAEFLFLASSGVSSFVIDQQSVMFKVPLSN